MRFLVIVTILSASSWSAAAQPRADASQPGTPDIAGVPSFEAPQQEPSSPTAPTTQSTGQAKDTEKGSSQNESSGTSKDRLFFALPNFLTLENAGNVPPLTTGEKFKATAQGSFDYVEYFWYGALAGIAQAENTDPSYGQGAEGYAKRFGEKFADGTIQNFMTKAIFPSFLHEDPRYFQLGKGGFKHRTWYALSRLFVTRTDSGQNRFNYSEVLGGAAAAAISTYSYHPRDDRNLANAGVVWGSQMGYDALSLVLKEFWPDIRRKLRKSHSAQTP
jgi:hypothetical protein